MNYRVLGPTMLLKKTLDAILHFLLPILRQLQISLFLGLSHSLSHRSVFLPSSSIVSFVSFMISTELAKKHQEAIQIHCLFIKWGKKGNFEDDEMEGRGDVNTKSLKCKLSKTKRNLHCSFFPLLKTKQDGI